MASIYSMVDNHFAELDKAYDEIHALSDTIEEMIAANDGEITGEIELLQNELEDKQADFKDMQEECTKEVLTKIDDYGRWLRNIMTDVKDLKAEEARITKRRRSLEHKFEWIRDNILYGMNAAETAKVTGTLFTASIRNTSSTEVDEAAALAPFKSIIEGFTKQLPLWLSFSPKFNKTLANKCEVLPAGFSKVSNQSLTLK